MVKSQFKKEIKKYKKIERIVFYLTVIIALLIILLSQKLYQTAFGRASLAYSLVSLAMITLLRVLKFWGPEN